MATKTISIDMEAYRLLKSRKKENESFSQTIKRLLPKPFDVEAWLNAMAADPLSDEAINAIEQVVAERRAPWNTKDSHDPRHHRADRSGGIAKKQPSAKRRSRPVGAGAGG